MRYYIAILVAFIPLFCYAQVPVTGVYSADVTMFRDEQSKTIYGHFNTSIQEGKISCAFNFHGKYKTLSDKQILIETSWPNDDDMRIKGLIIGTAQNSFIIKLNTSPPGAMACYDMDKDGYENSLSALKNWKGLRMIKPRKAFFYSEPNEAKRRKAYVTMYDVVGVLEFNGNWIKAEYCNYDTPSNTPVTTIGWLKTSDFFSNTF